MPAPCPVLPLAPLATPVERVECEGDVAVACYDALGVARLSAWLRAQRDKLAEYAERCGG